MGATPGDDYFYTFPQPTEKQLMSEGRMRGKNKSSKLKAPS
jgi:hypothetical protein